MAWKLIYPVLLGIAVYLAIVDKRTMLIPNRITLPLIIVGAVFHLVMWPEDFFIAFAMVIAMYIAWGFGAMGGGDAKLWMAMILFTPPLPYRLAIWGGVMALTALCQMAWRLVRKQPVIGVPSPAAWRVIPYILVILVLME